MPSCPPRLNWTELVLSLFGTANCLFDSVHTTRVHGPSLRPVNAGVQNDTPVHGPFSRPGSQFRPFQFQFLAFSMVRAEVRIDQASRHFISHGSLTTLVPSLWISPSEGRFPSTSVGETQGGRSLVTRDVERNTAQFRSVAVVCTRGCKGQFGHVPLDPPVLLQYGITPTKLYFVCQETLSVGSSCQQIVWSPGSDTDPAGVLTALPDPLTGGDGHKLLPEIPPSELGPWPLNIFSESASGV